MRPFEFQRAASESEAIAAAAAGARYLAGGTTLVDLMREEVEAPEKIVDINRLPLKYVRATDEEIVIGSLARMSEVAANQDVRRLQPLIPETLTEGASPQLRNVASIGGNLLQRVRCPYFRMLDAPCNKRVPGSGCSAVDGLNAGHAILGTSEHCVATHPSDLAVSLVALDATLSLKGPRGERTIPVAELFRLPEFDASSRAHAGTGRTHRGSPHSKRPLCEKGAILEGQGPILLRVCTRVGGSGSSRGGWSHQRGPHRCRGRGDPPVAHECCRTGACG